MNWLFEQTMPIVLMTVFGIILMISGYLQTGKRGLLFGAGAVGAIGLMLLIIGQVIVTEREKIRETIFAVAGAVERNDLPGVLRHVSPESDAIRRRIEAEFPRFEFGNVKIKRNLTIEIDEASQPPRGEANFNATVVVSDKTGFLKDRLIPRRVKVIFLHEGEQWLISDYQHGDPQRGL